MVSKTRVASVQPMPEALLALIKEQSNAVSSSKNVSIDSRGGSGGGSRGGLNLVQGARDDSLFRVATWLRRAGAPEQDADKVLKILGENCAPPFRDWRAKVASAYKGPPAERNIAEETREYILASTGLTLTSDCHKFLGLTTPSLKKACNNEFQRQAKAGVIESTGKKNGEYRKLDRQMVKLDWEKADPSKPLSVKMPFQIEEMVNLFHKNIVVVAGAPDAGKSAFMLNVVAQNMDKWKIRYFSSEMSEQELRLRLSLFEDTPINKWRFDAYERGRDFASVIDPNGLNIIDYMEVHENFHLIAQWLDEIFQKLKHGVAFVAIQKKRSGKDQQYDLGRGAEFSLERPRLYIAMDSGRLKIIKAKNWVRYDVNPNGKEFRFKLVGGCKFILDNPNQDEYEFKDLTVRKKEKKP